MNLDPIKSLPDCAVALLVNPSVASDGAVDPRSENQRSYADSGARLVNPAVPNAQAGGDWRFEALVAELSTRFINLPAEQVDSAIEEAQRLFCRTLCLDRSSLFQCLGQTPPALLLTHLYQSEAGDLARRGIEKRPEPRWHTNIYWIPTDTKLPPTYAMLDAKVFFPWVYQRIQSGVPLVLSCLEELPEEAAVDRGAFQRHGTRSTVVIPLAVGGIWLGCLSFATVSQPRKWSALDVKRFESVAHIFGNALARKRADEMLAQSEQRLSLATESAGVGLWGLQVESGQVWATAKLRELLQFSPEEELDLERFLRKIEGQDRERVNQTIQHAIETGEELQVEFRVPLAGGRLRWILACGRRQCDLSGKPEQLMGASVDVTQRNLAEEALARSCREIQELKERLQAETDYLKTEIKLTQAHGEIIGRSAAIQHVLRQVEQVAPVDCTVLITGETGTGKELVARAIHGLSSRRDRAMVLVNCAALPAPLVESELFGREKGAYTGALTSEVGRFEVADGSTIFLDEIGEVSLEVQAKLLRVLQNGEFQRLGNPKTRKVKVRVIAATNKDLAREVHEKRFREDLYYRLQVFPIHVPPLRERLEDLPLLVTAFVEEFSSRMSKQVDRIPRRVLESLERHSWPGNIRELRNIIERGVILSPGGTLTLPNLSGVSEATLPATSLAEVEREHILKTLESSRWRIKGRYGAAKVLGVNPSTLYSRMAKLGIRRPISGDGMPTEGR